MIVILMTMVNKNFAFLGEYMYFYDLPQNKKYYDFLDSSLYEIPTDIKGTDF